MPLLDSLDDWAREVGAVNTIVNRDGKLVGHNTDGYGFMQGLREAGFDPSGARALILGAGGAARGVVLALAYSDVNSIAIANRTIKRAERLLRDVGLIVPHLKCLPMDATVLAAEALSCGLIVNCTSLGMKHSPQENETPLRAEHIPQSCLAYDLVYNPLQTPFLREAKKAGARTMGGLTMLVHQGVAAFKLWTGRDAPADVMMNAGLSALAGT
jgi:shikimate dehydrogenase